MNSDGTRARASSPRMISYQEKIIRTFVTQILWIVLEESNRYHLTYQTNAKVYQLWYLRSIEQWEDYESLHPKENHVEKMSVMEQLYTNLSSNIYLEFVDWVEPPTIDLDEKVNSFSLPHDSIDITSEVRDSTKQIT